MGGRFCEIVGVCGPEGVGRRGWGEIGGCAGEEGGDWVGHFFLGGGRGKSVFWFGVRLCVDMCV